MYIILSPLDHFFNDWNPVVRGNRDSQLAYAKCYLSFWYGWSIFSLCRIWHWCRLPEASLEGFSDGSHRAFAYQFKVGIDLELSQNMGLLMGYRFFSTDNPKFGVFTGEMTTHSLEAGIKYFLTGPAEVKPCHLWPTSFSLITILVKSFSIHPDIEFFQWTTLRSLPYCHKIESQLLFIRNK